MALSRECVRDILEEEENAHFASNIFYDWGFLKQQIIGQVESSEKCF